MVTEEIILIINNLIRQMGKNLIRSAEDTPLSWVRLEAVSSSGQVLSHQVIKVSVR